MMDAAKRPIISCPCDSCDGRAREMETGAFYCKGYGLDFDLCDRYRTVTQAEELALQVAAKVAVCSCKTLRRDVAMSQVGAWSDLFDDLGAELDEDAFLARCGVHTGATA